MQTVKLSRPAISKPYTDKVISFILGEFQLFLLLFPFAEFFVTFGKWINLTVITNFLSTTLAGVSVLYLILRRRLDIDLKPSFLMFVFLFYLLISFYWVHPVMLDDARNFFIHTMLVIVQAIVIVQILSEKAPDEILNALKRFAIIVTILGLLSVIIFPSESSWTVDDSGRKQAFFSSPNNFGQFLAFAFLIINFYKRKELKLWKVLLLDVMIYFEITQCDSKTSLIGILVCFGCYHLRFLLKPLFYIVIAIGITLPIYTKMTNQSQNVQKVAFANRDLSFTGRSDVWDILMKDLKSTGHEMFGFGMGGYWGEKIYHPKSTMSELDWEPHQGHNGYLDIRVMAGLFGFILFLAFLLYYIRQLFKKTPHENVVIIFITLVILINNITESTLFRDRHFYFVVFMLLYWYVFLIKNNKIILNEGNISDSSYISEKN